MNLIDNSINEEENAFEFHPEFYKRGWEIIKLELARNMRLIEELLNFLNSILKKKIICYNDPHYTKEEGKTPVKKQ